jgi:dihydrofolate synthase / folylpolyglutamate synthase
LPVTSTDILESFRRDRARENRNDIDLTLRPEYLDLLAKLGNPHKKMPPVFHVAGTNGKGSTCAFLRAMLEAARYRVHVYTSPHLVRFHERIRIAGELISEEELREILGECRKLSAPGTITYFEAATAAAFYIFAKHPADFTILEVGLGGRLDATNVIEQPLVSIINRISGDHRDYLGSSLTDIAREKAGIMRATVPCFTVPQPDKDVLESLRQIAAEKNTPLSVGGKDWRVEILPDGFRYTDARHELMLPPPGLIGEHQYWNAGLAIAALGVLKKTLSQDAIARGLRNVEWPARLQKIERGSLYNCMPKGWELWLDGGHNDSAGEVLARQAANWRREAERKPLYLVCGELTTKIPREFLTPLLPYISDMQTVAIPGEALSFSADDLALQARALGIPNATAAESLKQALQALPKNKAGRVLVCGSLYLAGEFLRQNDAAL